MKTVRKIIVLLITIIIFTLSLPLSASAENDMRFGRQILSSKSNSATLLSVYDELKRGCEKAESTITLSAEITTTNFKTVMAAFTNDYPEYFWVTGGYSYIKETDSIYVDSVSPTYLFERSKIAAAQASLDAMASKMLEGLEGKSDYDKALIIHDRLAERVVYKKTDNDQTAYGAIVEGEAVCAGYARAYHYLLQRVGIEAWSISGTSINPTTFTLEGHRWNMVKLDNKWYYTDVTWDDNPNFIFHNYFNRTLSYFKQTHFADTFSLDLPDDNNNEMNYFTKNNLVFDKVDTNRLVKLLKASNNTANFFISGDANAFLESLNSKMIKIASAINPNGGRYSYTTLKLGGEIFLKLVIEPTGHKHSPKKVAEVSASCYQVGVKEHYKCSCGRIFSDSKGKNELSSPEVLDKTSHTESSEWRYDNMAHWKYCTVCDADIDSSSALHEDDNNDKVCDVCLAEVTEIFTESDIDQTSENKKEIPPVVIGVVVILVVLSLFRKIKKK